MIELTVMVALIGFNHFALGGSASTQLYERAEAVSRIFANAVSDAVIATDLATLDATIASAVSDEEVTYLRIKSASGAVLAQGGDAAALATPFVRDADFEAAQSDHLIDVDLQIVVAGTAYGAIELGLSTLAVEEQISQALKWNILVALLGMSLVAVFGYGLGTILTRQLRGLRQGARAIAAGDLSCQIKVHGRDELADTARCFNNMAQKLERDRAVLQEQQDELLDKKARVEVLVGCLRDISEDRDIAEVPDAKRPDEIGDMARATVAFYNAKKKIERARLQQQRLVSAFDQVDEQVAIFGTDGTLLFANRAFRSFNAEICEALPPHFTLRGFLNTGLKQGAFPNVADKAAWVDEQMAHQNGSPYEIQRSGNCVLLATQSRIEGIGTVFSARDVTELRNSENQLIQASKLATLGEMATGVAHELNQPLGVIRMAATNCVKRIDKGKWDVDYLRSKLVRVGEQTSRAAQIIDHMRLFGRKADGVHSPFDLRQSLTEILALARPKLSTGDVSLTLDLPDGTAFVMGERVIFEQVLLNLVSNAHDAIQSSGETEGKIVVSASFDGEDGHVIKVTDNGGGVPEALLDKLFEPFFTTKDPGKGTGLGLSISFGTIRDMGGKLSVHNAQTGACFKICLPAFQHEAVVENEQIDPAA